MARKRMIDPHIWEDPAFNRLSRDARLLFIGMISNADDEGYVRGDTGSLKRLVFGFEEITLQQIEGWLEELSHIKTLHFYVVDEEQYAHFLKWNEYQKQQKDRIQASTYPKCSKCVADDNQVITEVKLSKEKLVLNTGDKRPENQQTKQTLHTPGMSSLKAVLESKGIPVKQEKNGISTPWQEKALRWATDLQIKLGPSDKPRWFKAFKDASIGRKSSNLETAYSFLKDSPSFQRLDTSAKMRYFFSIYENGITNKFSKKGG